MGGDYVFHGQRNGDQIEFDDGDVWVFAGSEIWAGTSTAAATGAAQPEAAGTPSTGTQPVGSGDLQQKPVTESVPDHFTPSGQSAVPGDFAGQSVGTKPHTSTADATKSGVRKGKTKKK